MTGGDVGARLRAARDAAGISVPPGFDAAVRVFLDELARWQRVTRLTGYATEDAQIRYVVLDSLLFLTVIPEPGAPLLDIGSGAGIPGLVLKLARPGWAVTLVEANRRRANFLRQVRRRLGLEGLEIHEARAESLARRVDMAGRFRTVTLRAVAVPARALALARPFLAPDGSVVLGHRMGAAVAAGVVRSVDVGFPGQRLRHSRTFLIMPASQIVPAGQSRADVPRGT